MADLKAATVPGLVVTKLLHEIEKHLLELETENKKLREENEILRDSKMPQTLNMKFIAEYCGVSRSTAGNWLNSGRIKANKVDGRWLINREDFMKWVNNEAR